MPVRIRLSRGGAKKRPFYRIVVADSRRARDGKFIDQIGTYNPMLPKDSADRVKMDLDKAKEWIAKGAKPSDRISIFLSNHILFLFSLFINYIHKYDLIKFFVGWYDVTLESSEEIYSNSQ